MYKPTPHIYEFGAFRRAAARRLLLRRDDGEAIKLTPKAFDTLLYMVTVTPPARSTPSPAPRARPNPRIACGNMFFRK